MDFAKILEEAHNEASAAILARFKSGEREAPFNCGFAWVTIAGNSPLARYCRSELEKGADARLGSKGHPKGWQFWGPGKWPSKEAAGVEAVYGQDMDFLIAGARAFKRVLSENGYDATLGYRLD